MVHPSNPGNPATLWDGMRSLLAYEIANGARLSIVTRLDRETSGVVLVAKNPEAAREFGMAMEGGEFQKTYQAITWGWPEEDTFEINVPLLRKGEAQPSAVWVRRMAHPGGKPSLTRVTVLDRWEADTTNGNRFSLLQCEPLTGRTHQIRAHLHHAGHPIVGDKIYGPSEECYLEFIETGWNDRLERILLLNRQALHARGLRWSEHHWESPLPKDLGAFLPAEIRSAAMTPFAGFERNRRKF
jgi:23S rRNA pseudouridine1911/1915/1917 synthase